MNCVISEWSKQLKNKYQALTIWWNSLYYPRLECNSNRRFSKCPFMNMNARSAETLKRFFKNFPTNRWKNAGIVPESFTNSFPKVRFISRERGGMWPITRINRHHHRKPKPKKPHRKVPPRKNRPKKQIRHRSDTSGKENPLPTDSVRRWTMWHR